MNDDTDEALEEVKPYVLNCWDCPECDTRNETDADLGSTETCDDCGTQVLIRT